ncbi:MAG: DUF371 domain-containing protein [Desulfurococcaceae archaeon]
MICCEIIRAKGHPNIRATHRTTLEITKDNDVTPRGDCIIGVSADKAAFDLNEDFKRCLRRENSILVLVLKVNELKDVILAEGSPILTLSDKNRIIIRKSTYIEPATIGVRANKASMDIKRSIVELLRNPNTILIVYLYVLQLDEITSIYSNSGGIFHY